MLFTALGERLRPNRRRRPVARPDPPGPGPSHAAAGLIALLMLALPAAARETAYTVAGSELYRLDLESGELTLEGDFGVAGIQVLAIDPSGVLFAATSDELMTIDPEIPAATPIGPTGLAPSPRLNSMTFDPEGRQPPPPGMHLRRKPAEIARRRASRPRAPGTTGGGRPASAQMNGPYLRSFV